MNIKEVTNRLQGVHELGELVEALGTVSLPGDTYQAIQLIDVG